MLCEIVEFGCIKLPLRSVVQCRHRWYVWSEVCAGTLAREKSSLLRFERVVIINLFSPSFPPQIVSTMDANQEAIAKKAVKALKARIEVVNRHLEPLLSAPLSETYGKLPVNEKAQLQVLLSYTINSLFYSMSLPPSINPSFVIMPSIYTYLLNSVSQNTRCLSSRTSRSN